VTKSEYAIEKTLEHEGGYVDHPADPGGATQFGISLRWYREHVDPDADVGAIMRLTKSDAIDLYEKYFWDEKYDLIHDRDVAAKVFDMAVNMGSKQAHKLFQRALLACGKDVDDDGIVGPATLKAANGVEAGVLMAALRATQAGFYRGLVMKKASNEAFIKGWLRRAYA